jgi:uracil-DNA glycosylase
MALQGATSKDGPHLLLRGRRLGTCRRSNFHNRQIRFTFTFHPSRRNKAQMRRYPYRICSVAKVFTLDTKGSSVLFVMYFAVLLAIPAN